MNGKFMVYAVLVTALSTGISWTKFLSSASAGWQSGGSGRSAWSSSTSGSGGTWGSGSGGGFGEGFGTGTRYSFRLWYTF